MNALKKIAVAVLLLSFTVFVALFGRLPALRYVSCLVETPYFIELKTTQENSNRSAPSPVVCCSAWPSARSRCTSYGWTTDSRFLAIGSLSNGREPSSGFGKDRKSRRSQCLTYHRYSSWLSFQHHRFFSCPLLFSALVTCTNLLHL